MTTQRAPDAWVRTIDPDDARQDDAHRDLTEAYAWQARSLGAVTEYTQLGSLHPPLVRLRLELYKTVEATLTGFTPVERALVVYVASLLNQTPHCASGALLALDAAGAGPRLVARAAADPWDAATGSDRLDAIVRYTALLTATPGEVTRADVDRLRDTGLDDADVVALNNLVAYYAYTNRVATGLGLHSQIPADHALRAVPR